MKSKGVSDFEIRVWTCWIFVFPNRTCMKSENRFCFIEIFLRGWFYLSNPNLHFMDCIFWKSKRQNPFLDSMFYWEIRNPDFKIKSTDFPIKNTLNDVFVSKFYKKKFREHWKSRNRFRKEMLLLEDPSDLDM